MAKTVELLLTESVESLGIVGDVVKVRTGYARNFLLPRALATTPSEEKIAALAEKRREAERQLAELRARRESLIERLEGVEITLERSCNDQGLLYGAIHQADIAQALADEGYDVRDRDIRIPQSIKRIDSYEITVKPEPDLEATIKLWVVSDRPLELDEDTDEQQEGEVAEGAEGEQPAGEGEGEAAAQGAENAPA